MDIIFLTAKSCWSVGLSTHWSEGVTKSVHCLLLEKEKKLCGINKGGEVRNNNF